MATKFCDMSYGILAQGYESQTFCFRNTSDEFVAFLGVADAETTEIVATRIREAIVRHPVDIPGGASSPVLTNVTAVISPSDGASLQELLAVAKERSKSPATGRDGASNPLSQIQSRSVDREKPAFPHLHKK